MSLQEFSQGSESTSIADGNLKERHQNSDRVNTSRPQSAKTKTTIPRAENKVNVRSTEEGKLLHDTQIEERRKKLQARKAAVEERQKHKEINDSAKSEAMRQLIEQKGHSGPKATGRKLPNVPSNSSSSYARRETSATRRLSSSSSSSDSMGHTPPGSGRNTSATRRNLTGPTSASTSSLNSFGSTQYLSKPRTNLGASKKASASASNLNDKTLTNKRTGLRVKEKGLGVSTNVGSTLPKARSMNAIHQVGHRANKGSASRPPSGKKGNPKQTHHAGTSNELEAKQALAERRKRIREEAERKALMDREKQEELRRQREEEEKRLAEENAKEMARQAALAEELHKDEEERAKILREQRKKEAAIEAERVAAEMKRKEEMEALRKLEIERRAKEAEKREKEEEERLRKEEIERQERRKRVEMIMSRTRLTSTVNNNMIKSETYRYSSLEDLSTKLSDEYHSNTVSEILQKVKEKRASPSPEKDADQQKENERLLDNPGKDSVNGKNENTNDVLRVIDNSKHGSNVRYRELDSNVSKEDNQGTLRFSDRDLMDSDGTSWDIHGTSKDIRNISKDTYSTLSGIDYGTSRDTDRTLMDIDDFSRSCDSTSTNIDSFQRDNKGSPRVNRSTTRVTMAEVNDGFKEITQDSELWKNVEHLMISTEMEVRERIEIFEEDDDDEDSEEGQLWKVVEGKRDISEVI